MKKVFIVGMSLLFVLVGCTSKDVDQNSITSSETSEEKMHKLTLSEDSPAFSEDGKKAYFVGTLPPGEEVELFFKSKSIGKTSATNDGTFSIEIDTPAEHGNIEAKSKTDNVTLYFKNPEKEKQDDEKKAADEAAEKKKQDDEQAKRDTEAAEAKKIADEKIAEENRIANEKKAADDAARNKIANAPRQHKNALQKAKDYLDYSSFSKQGLYDQLIFEDFPTDAAQFAIDNIVVDWNAQALSKAKDYLEYSSFSDQGLYDQLIFEGYTAEQSQYAINNLPN